MEDAKQNECTVCYEKTYKLNILDCLHAVCDSCIESIKKEYPVCPLCKESCNQVAVFFPDPKPDEIIEEDDTTEEALCEADEDLDHAIKILREYRGSLVTSKDSLVYPIQELQSVVNDAKKALDEQFTKIVSDLREQGGAKLMDDYIATVDFHLNRASHFRRQRNLKASYVKSVVKLRDMAPALTETVSQIPVPIVRLPFRKHVTDTCKKLLEDYSIKKTIVTFGTQANTQPALMSWTTVSYQVTDPEHFILSRMFIGTSYNKDKPVILLHDDIYKNNNFALFDLEKTEPLLASTRWMYFDQVHCLAPNTYLFQLQEDRLRPMVLAGPGTVIWNKSFSGENPVMFHDREYEFFYSCTVDGSHFIHHAYFKTELKVLYVIPIHFRPRFLSFSSFAMRLLAGDLTRLTIYSITKKSHGVVLVSDKTGTKGVLMDNGKHYAVMSVSGQTLKFFSCETDNDETRQIFIGNAAVPGVVLDIGVHKNKLILWEKSGREDRNIVFKMYD